MEANVEARQRKVPLIFVGWVGHGAALHEVINVYIACFDKAVGHEQTAYREYGEMLALFDELRITKSTLEILRCHVEFVGRLADLFIGQSVNLVIDGVKSLSEQALEELIALLGSGGLG